MNSLEISSGTIRIAINDDPERVIEFNPSDVLFAERFYSIYKEIETKQAEYLQRSKDLDKQAGELDENGLPANIQNGIAFLREACEYMREKIDYLFGPGTSQKAFGDALSLDMITQFFDGMTPYVEKARNERLVKYKRTEGKRRVMK